MSESVWRSCRYGSLTHLARCSMALIYPALFQHPNDNEPESWQPTDHIFYGQAKLKIERSEGVTFWEGAKEKSEKM